MAKVKKKLSVVPDPAPAKEETVNAADLITQLAKILQDANSSGFLLVVADSQGAINTSAAARNFGDLTLLNHFAGKEVSRILDRGNEAPTK